MKTLLAALALLSDAPAEHPDTLYSIEQVEITASLKSGDPSRLPIASTEAGMYRLEREGVESIKDFSAISPNFYQPAYGSRMTSSIYVRGFGSRIDQPVVGVNVDDVPYMNKNAYDFDFYDIRRIELLRGPQGTLYGRNTSGGVMNISTLSPMVWQGARLSAEYSSAESYALRAAWYDRRGDSFGYSLAASFAHCGGFFTNVFNDEKCDRSDNAGARLRLQWHPSLRWRVDATTSVGYTDEGGYAYRLYDEHSGTYHPIAYNDPCAYRRLSLCQGLVVGYESAKVRLSSVTSYQFLDDRMTLDQDFTPRSLFTLVQSQREHAVTQDIVVRNADPEARWQWLCGAFAFGKRLDMSSPVTFKRDGIDDLILDNANKHIHDQFPDNDIEIGTDSFVIASDFRIPVYGAALYHESSARLGRWTLTAGLRFDYEYTSMKYDSRSELPYRFNLTMPEFKMLHTRFAGSERQSFFELLPKLSATYSMRRGEVYATVTRGYKAGGFNTQIFSDILQSKMMTDMMTSLGVYIDGVGTTSYDSAAATRYKPERSWNFEIGAHLRPAAGLNLSAAAFLIECTDQQVTVLPDGNNTGRMMSNAGRARSLGVELSVRYDNRNLSVAADWGFTDARFTEYDDGKADRAGNVLPYAPRNTASLSASYTWHVGASWLDRITLGARLHGVGEIYWNEENTLRQPFYTLLSAHVGLQKGAFSLSVWGRNLTDRDYDTFYFKSVSRSFFSKGRPISFGIKLNVNI